MKLALLIYRIIYGVSLAAILAAVAQEILGGVVGGISALVPTCLFACTLGAAFFATFAFRRLGLSLLWVLTVMLSGLFTWYGWFGPGAPFILHEVNTFDPAAATHEISRYRLQGLAVNAILLFWFVSLPIVRRLSRNPVHPAGQ